MGLSLDGTWPATLGADGRRSQQQVAKPAAMRYHTVSIMPLSAPAWRDGDETANP